LAFFFSVDTAATMGTAFLLSEVPAPPVAAAASAGGAWSSAVGESSGRFALAAGFAPPPKNALVKSRARDNSYEHMLEVNCAC
jgi:hypothetical protein